MPHKVFYGSAPLGSAFYDHLRYRADVRRQFLDDSLDHLRFESLDAGGGAGGDGVDGGREVRLEAS